MRDTLTLRDGRNGADMTGSRGSSCKWVEVKTVSGEEEPKVEDVTEVHEGVTKVHGDVKPDSFVFFFSPPTLSVDGKSRMETLGGISFYPVSD